MSKRNVMVSFEKLPELIRSELRKRYPDGFHEHIKAIRNHKAQTIHVLRYETSDSVYLIKMDNIRAEIANFLSESNAED